MGSKFYIHIGVHKTGTSTIQSFLHKNREKLQNHDIIYPDIGLEGPAHHILACRYLPTQRIPDYYQPAKEYLQNLAKLRRKEPDKTFLLSSEYFSAGQKLDLLKNDLVDIGAWPVKIVVYLRQQDSMLESTYNQNIKALKGTSPFQGNYNKNLDWFAFLQKWEKAFGQENIIVKIYDKNHMQPGLIANFLQIFSLKEESFCQTQNTNISLDLDLLEFKRLANIANYPVDIKTLNTINRSLPPLVNYRLLSREQRCEILKQYEESNHKVAIKYFARAHLFAKKPLEQLPECTQYQGLKVERAALLFLYFLKDSQQKLHSRNQKNLNKIKKYLYICFFIISLQSLILLYWVVKH